MQMAAFIHRAIVLLALTAAGAAWAQIEPGMQGALGPLGPMPGAGPATVDASVTGELAVTLGDEGTVEFDEAVRGPDGSIKVVGFFGDANAVVRALRQLGRPGSRYAGMRMTTLSPAPRKGATVPMVTFEGRLDVADGEALAQAYVLEQVTTALPGMELPGLRLERIVDSPHGRMLTVDISFSGKRAAFDAFTRAAATFARVDNPLLTPETGERERGLATLRMLVPAK